MGIFSKFERKMEDTVEGAADKMVGSPLSPVQIAKKAEKQMRREKMVGAGKQYAPTLYTVLVNGDDDERLFGYYPTLAGETETYLAAKAGEHGLVMDGQPLVRFIVDDELKRGKFEIIAEMVAAPIVSQLRQEEMERYGISIPQKPAGRGQNRRAAYDAPAYGEAAYGASAYNEPAYDAPAYDGFDEPAYGEGAYGEPAYGDAAYGEGDFAEHPNTMMFQDAGQPDPFAPEPQNLTAYLYDITNDRAFTLNRPRMTIGREGLNNVVIPDINASRSHAEIRQEANGAWVLSDLGSTNGTWVNGRRIKSAPLKDADMIRIGTTDIEFQLI